MRDAIGDYCLGIMISFIVLGFLLIWITIPIIFINSQVATIMFIVSISMWAAGFLLLAAYDLIGKYGERIYNLIKK